MNRLSSMALGVLLLLAAGGYALADHPHGKIDAPDLDKGESLYNTTCVACHGSSGKGQVPGVPDLRGSDSRLKQKSIETLLHNVDEGYQSPGSMLAMPARGGNPGLSEQDLVDILGYMRQHFAGEG